VKEQGPISYFIEEFLKPATWIVVFFISVVVLVLALSGCGGQLPAPPAPNGSKTEEVPPELYEDDPDSLAPSGNLPPGYNQRQCQWDACGGPMPLLPAQAIDPQPEMMR
jgi:hypothetical protein